MGIFECVVSALSECDRQIFSTYEIKDIVCSRVSGINPESIIPSDYCYNRTNKGIKFNQHCFIRLSRGEYRFVGCDYSYQGPVYGGSKGSERESLLGFWIKGEFVSSESQNFSNLSRAHLEFLYEEYLKVFEVEVNVLGQRPAELRHLIGRIGELKCALKVNGSLARVVNQHGFDVVDSEGRRISVKTTSQTKNFVRVSGSTLYKGGSRIVDDVMVIQYFEGDFSVIYFGEIEHYTHHASIYKNGYELNINSSKKLMNERLVKGLMKCVL